MFISSFEEFREDFLSKASIVSMAHIGERGFDSIGGAVVSTTAFVANNRAEPDKTGIFIKLTDGRNEMEKSALLLSVASRTNVSAMFKVSAADLARIPGTPIAYWTSESVRLAFSNGEPLGSMAYPRKGNTTTDNARFLRFWPEVSICDTSFDEKSDEAFTSGDKTWAPYNKGGGYRKWHGFNDFLINWKGGGAEIKAIPHSVIANEKFFFTPGWTWSTVSTGRFAVRAFGPGYVFDNGGCCIFGKRELLDKVGPFMNSSVFTALFSEINPTLNFQSGEVAKVPVVDKLFTLKVHSGHAIAKSDWDAYETSWDFTTLPLLSPDYRGDTLEASYARLRAHWQGMTDAMQRLEEENNRIFIDAYGLQDELTPEVPLEEITLTCNPAYRYGVKGSEEDRETRLRADTMAEFLSYAVGCMFGRYSLDAPGLILANQGERLEDYLARIPEPSFVPDADNVIPVLDGDWFADDITERFRLFLRVTFGEAHFRENLRYVEEALGKDIRKYFTRDFYADHVKRYKKRPIYWMFSSPKGTFNALIYMHRYRGDTVSVLLNDYLREFISKLIAERERLEKLSDDPTATQGQRTKALKEAGVVAKQIDELNEWEREVIFPLAQQQIEIDLDDGVKANYPKFGSALKKIPGLEAKDD
nr:BREX-1 system adenine-specific DNA-methyltransferase PglX [Thalassobius vesicularis]